MRFGHVQRAEMAIGFDLFYSDPAKNRWYLELTERSLHPRNSISVRGRSRIESLVRHIDVAELVDLRLRFIHDSDPRKGKGKVEWLIESDVLDQEAITAEYVATLTRVLFPFFARKLNATAYQS